MRKNNIYRILLQVLILASILFYFLKSVFTDTEVDFEAYCPFGGLQSFITLFNNGNLACSISAVNLTMAITLIVAIIFFGKLFCSYLCPLGAIAEFIGRLGDKLKVRREVNGIADKVFRSFKYILLFITVYFTLENSELFCKTYDPFYSSVTLFGHKVDYLYATISISVFLIGSLLLRLFWCKYLCPLGAVSNIFKHISLFVGIAALYFIAHLCNLKIELIYYVALGCIIGYIVEISNNQLKKINMLKITRHEKVCVDCGLCTSKCPQGIDVASLKKVTHPDCNMCGDCVESCPKTGALTINNIKIKWLPLIVVSCLLILAMIVGHRIEIPTTDEHWGGKVENEKTVIVSGFDKMKCVSSAMSYMKMFKKTKGVTGAATYVKSRTAKLTYNPKVTDENTLLKRFFKPVRKYIKDPKSNDENITIYKVIIDNNIGSGDIKNLSDAFTEMDVYQVETQFKKGVEVIVFCNSEVSDKKLESKISEIEENMYRVKSITKSPVKFSGLALNKRNLKMVDFKFNGMKKLPKDKIAACVMEITRYKRNVNDFKYLANYIGKKYKSILGLKTLYKDKPLAIIYYKKGEIDPKTILEESNRPEYKIIYTNGMKENIENSMSFKLIE